MGASLVHGHIQGGLAVRTRKGKDKGLAVRSSDDYELGTVERKVESEHGAVVVWAAGTNPNGTKAAVYYLTENWDRLFKKCGEGKKNTSFAICIRCAKRDGYRKPQVQYQWPDSIAGG